MSTTTQAEFTTAAAPELVNVQEKWSDVEGEIATIEGLGRKEQSSSRIFTALFAEPCNAACLAYTAEGIPEDYSIHPYCPDQRLRRKWARVINPYLWEVHCEYAGEASPLTAPYEKSWRSASSLVEVNNEWDGADILNPVGELYPDYYKRLWGDPIYVVTRNEAEEPIDTTMEYRYVVNSDEFKGQERYTALMLPITCQRMIYNSGPWSYWRVTYQIQFRVEERPWETTTKGEPNDPTGWKLRIVCMGSLEWARKNPGDTWRDGGAMKHVKGRWVKKIIPSVFAPPVRLALNGMRLDLDDENQWQLFDIYQPKNFGALSLE